MAEVCQDALGRAKRLTSTRASAAMRAVSSSSAAVSKPTPDPCETRWTGTSRRTASSSTASRQRGPSVLGISMRYCAPSGKRFPDDGRSYRSPGGRPSEDRNGRVDAMMCLLDRLGFHLSQMPVVGEQIKINISSRMLPDDVLVHGDSQARSRGKSKIPVDNGWVAGCRLVHVRLGEVIEVFLNLEVGSGGSEVQGRCRRHGTTHIVRRHLQIVGLRPAGDLPGLQNAAGHGEIGLHDIARLQLEQLAVLGTQVNALSGGDRDIDV